MIIKVEVKELYGAFNHKIELKEENITLLLGENGLGKTVILRMIKAFFDKDFFELQTYLFSELVLFFDDKTKISVKKITNEDDEIKLTFNFYRGNKKEGEKHEMEFSTNQLHGRRSMRRGHQRDLYFYDDIHFELERYLPSHIERIGSDIWVDAIRGIHYSTQDLFERYGKNFPPHLRKLEFEKKLPDWLLEKSQSVKTKFIETQRLLTRTKAQESEYKSSVVRYSQVLVEKIKNKTVDATDLASKLDRSFPNRVINQITQPVKISDYDLQEGLQNLSKKRDLLNKVGLLDSEEEHLPINFQTSHSEILKDVLQVYLQDSNEKLAIYNELARRIDLLMNIINKRFLYKKLSIDKNNGFGFTSVVNGKQIPLSGLSSGEQHELVLFFQLLFDTEPNSMLLIDEPEISLHISWQNHFINDLREVIELNNLSALIATHSPDIINKNWNYTVILKGE